jgi:exopolyphosphatase/guanosine-5'-triphosphate,3'-diphosphate pyrophosphatase
VNKLDAVIELGSNSIKFLLVDNGKIIKEGIFVTQFLKSIRLGEIDLDSPFWKDTRKHILDLIVYFQKNYTNNIYFLTTAAARKIKDWKKWSQFLENEFRVPIVRLNLQEEAQLGYLVLEKYYSDSDLLVLDVGGGSTEVSFKSDELFLKESLPLGAITLTDRFEMERTFLKKNMDIKKYCYEHLKVLSEKFSLRETKKIKLLGIGGAATLLPSLIKKGKYDFSPEKWEGTVLAVNEIKSFLFDLSQVSADERVRKWDIPEKRAAILPAGLFIILSVIEYLQLDFLTISFKGIRNFILFDDLKGKVKQWIRKK